MQQMPQSRSGSRVVRPNNTAPRQHNVLLLPWTHTSGGRERHARSFLQRCCRRTCTLGKTKPRVVACRSYRGRAHFCCSMQRVFCGCRHGPRKCGVAQQGTPGLPADGGIFALLRCRRCTRACRREGSRGIAFEWTGTHIGSDVASNSMVDDDVKSSSLPGTRWAMIHGPGMIGGPFAALRLLTPDELLCVFSTKQI